MSYYVFDVEHDGPVPGINSMVSFALIKMEPDRSMDTVFYGEVAPISNEYRKDTLDFLKLTRKEHEAYSDPKSVMERCAKWIKETNGKDRPTLLSDNNGADFGWLNYYFHVYYGENPFGWTSRRIGDLFCGFKGHDRYTWKRHRKTKHTHHPVDDVKGNAEALWVLIDMGFKLKIR